MTTLAELVWAHRWTLGGAVVREGRGWREKTLAECLAEPHPRALLIDTLFTPSPLWTRLRAAP